MEGGACLSPPRRGELTGCAPHLSRVSAYWEDGASRRRLWGTWPRVFYPEDPLKPTALTRGLSLHPPDCRMCVPPRITTLVTFLFCSLLHQNEPRGSTKA